MLRVSNQPISGIPKESRALLALRKSSRAVAPFGAYGVLSLMGPEESYIWVEVPSSEPEVATKVVESAPWRMSVESEMNLDEVLH